MFEASFVSGMITFVVVSVIAVIDYNRFRIPNSITIPFALSGLLFHYINFGFQGFLISLFGLILGFILLIAPYALGGFGGGDVKLLAAMGAWLGVQGIMWVFIVSAVLLGTVSLILICRSEPIRRAAFLNLRVGIAHLRGVGNFLGGEDRVEEVVLREDRRNRAVPFGVILSVGMALVLVWKLFVIGVN